MTYPTSGGTPDPYQPQQPYGSPYEQPGTPYPSDPSLSSGQPAYGSPPPPPPYGQPQYGAAPGYGYPAALGTNTLAILALVFAFIFPIAGVVMGHIAKKQIRQTGEQGEGLATAGLVIGYIFTAIGLVICAFYVIIAIVAINDSGTTY
ncbi:MAG: DUF4190 domain-containing protein [Actinoplanes sp.]